MGRQHRFIPESGVYPNAVQSAGSVWISSARTVVVCTGSPAYYAAAARPVLGSLRIAGSLKERTGVGDRSIRAVGVGMIEERRIRRRRDSVGLHQNSGYVTSPAREPKTRQLASTTRGRRFGAGLPATAGQGLRQTSNAKRTFFMGVARTTVGPRPAKPSWSGPSPRPTATSSVACVRLGTSVRSCKFRRCSDVLRLESRFG